MKVQEILLNHMVEHLLHICKHELELDSFPKLYFIHDKPTTNSGTSFGEFTGNKIEVVTLKRHPMDIMRTIAHELVHWKQLHRNMPMDGDDGSADENEANAVAGVIMRKFGRQFPHYFINSIP